MKRVRRPIKANQGVTCDFLFTADEVVQLLAQMDELRDYPVSYDDSNGALQIIVGDSVYQIMDSKPSAHR